jgi:hypothetical protein
MSENSQEDEQGSGESHALIHTNLNQIGSDFRYMTQKENRPHVGKRISNLISKKQEDREVNTHDALVDNR